MLRSLYRRFSNDIGIDLGTANTLVYLRGHGIIINEPSIVAINQKTGQIVAVGREAKEMWGKTPEHIKIVRPLIEGVVSDYEMTEEMLGYFIRKVEKISRKFFRPRVVIGVPSGITNVEVRAVYDAAIDAGAREVYLVEEAMAAAIGVRLPVLTSQATFIVDIGGGTTDIALIALGGIVRSLNLRVAGDHFNMRIVEYFRDEFKLLVGEQTAEQVKLSLGSAAPTDYMEIEVRGRDLTTGLPRALIATDGDIREALMRPVALLLAGIHEVLETAPPEMVSDILQQGIVLAGGGALLRGLAPLLERDLKLPVTIAEDPLSAVARGTGVILEDFDTYRGVILTLDDHGII
ncbi:MAG TPA: rod shape-determining protein [Candidatus Paceibacterota bacterium]|jgi:rod shape-determining protein MreB|nr:rod shape-determining protein [Candidatus Paceibacterota bacterium]